MKVRDTKLLSVLLFAILLAACGGGGGGSSSGPQPQTIVFANSGPVSGAVGTTVSNTASGGGGSGAITYVSSNVVVATVNPTTGVATLNAVGSATITATKAASSGFNQANATYTLNATPGPQTIGFSQVGSLQLLKGASVNNAASGGAGTGAITYVSSDTGVANVDSSSGVVTATGIGAATITATKAADTNYNQAQATYALTVVSSVAVKAWIGSANTQVTFDSAANGANFIRSRDRNCNLLNYANCTSGQSDQVAGSVIADSAVTVNNAGYYWLSGSGAVSNPMPVSANRFSERIGHAALFFNNRYWVIGGATPTIGSPIASANAKADIWSSADGKTWELVTSSAPFGARWFHQSVVYNNKIWVIGGIKSSNGLANDVWSSSDGVTWSQVAASTPFAAYTHEDLNVTVFKGAMWAVFAGRSFSSTDGAIWTAQSAVGAIDSGTPRGYASLTVFNGKLWYIGGARAFTGGGGTTGNAVNDVWSSDDGIAWSQVTGAAAFSPRLRHAAFVMNNRLWVFGGQQITAGVGGQAVPDAYSTLDGLTWTQEATSTQIDRSYMTAVVQDSNKVTLIGGIVRGYSNKAWQSSDGNQWTELSPYAEFSPRISAEAVEFQGDLWLIGGFTAEGTVSNEIWRSSDGLNWLQITPVGSIFSPRDAVQVVVFNSRLWVIGGWDESVANGGTDARVNDVWSSDDGNDWTQHTPASAIFSPRIGSTATVFNGKIWVIGGDTGTTAAPAYVNDVWSTVDGVNWVQEKSNAAFSPRSEHSVVAYNNSLWLFGGDNGSGLADIWKSADGVTWTAVTPVGPSFSARLGQAVTVFNNRIWLTGGWSAWNYDNATRFNDVWSTADGITWESNTAQFDKRTWPSLVNYNNELWLIGGLGLDPKNDVWRSVDGVSWRLGFNGAITMP